MQKYQSRESAGKILAEKILTLSLKSAYLLAIPRGGIQVAEGIADVLNIPIDALVVKKLPAPGNPEYGFGAVTEDGTAVLNDEAVSGLHLNENVIGYITQQVVQEIQHRKEIYGELDDGKISKSDVIIVDDGIATGYSLIAGINTVKKRKPKSITVAVPVSSYSAFSNIKGIVDNFICPIVSDEYFFAVGNYYEEWYDLSEEQIKEILDNSRLGLT